MKVTISMTCRVMCILFLKAKKKGLVMVNFFSYFITCSNHSTINDVIGKCRHLVRYSHIR